MMAALCAPRVEDLARKGDVEGCAALAAVVDGEFERVKAALHGRPRRGSGRHTLMNASAHILVIDDDRANRLILARALEEEDSLSKQPRMRSGRSASCTSRPPASI